jgi:hypothetical protein
MKKLIIALAAALLALTACEEKTATYTYNGAQITYPASWKLQDMESMLYIQDQKILSNSVDVSVYEMDEQSLAASSSEDLAEFLKSMVYNEYEDTVSDDYVISFETEIEGTDSQAMMSLSGTAYGDPFVGTITAWLDDNIAFCTFVSAKDDKEMAKIVETFKYEVL